MIEAVMRALPHDARRRVYSVLRRQKYRRLQKMRTADENYSYKQFDDLRCIFVHIPKAAGVSVARSLFGNLAGGHTSVETYQLVFSKREFEEYFKFTFVRNPWDRLLSAYRFLKKGGMNQADRQWAEVNLAAYKTFDEFVMRGLGEKRLPKYHHFTPQYQFLCPPNEAKAAVDFLGLYENINADFDYVQGRIFGNRDRALPYENRSNTHAEPNYTDAYTEAMRAVVATVYAEDIVLLGYTFDNSSLKSQLASRDSQSSAFHTTRPSGV